MNLPPVIGVEASRPNPALAPLAFLIGEWRTTGTHDLMPGKQLHGRTSFAWIEGGAFLMMRSEIHEAEIPSGVAIFGTDDGLGAAFMIYFDERGVSRKYDAVIGEGFVTLSRDDPKLAQRMTIQATDDGDALTNQGRASENGGEWRDDLSLTCSRIEA